MKIRMYTGYADGEESWTEDYDIEKGEDPEEYCRGLIENFNATLRPREEPRRFDKVEILDDSESPLHKWEKTNMFTIRAGSRTYDTYRCIKCGITAKRFGVSSSSIIPDKEADRDKPCGWRKSKK